MLILSGSTGAFLGGGTLRPAARVAGAPAGAVVFRGPVPWVGPDVVGAWVALAVAEVEEEVVTGSMVSGSGKRAH